MLVSAPKSALYKPCTSAAFASEFNRANGILRLESGRASLYGIKVIKMSRLTIDRLLHYGTLCSHCMGTYLLYRQETQTKHQTPVMMADLKPVGR